MEFLSHVDPIHVATVVVAVAAALLTWLIWSVHNHFFTRPKSILRQLRAQGIPGHPFRPFVGQLADLIKMRRRREEDPEYAASTLAVQWFLDSSRELGPMWTFSLGPSPRVVIVDPGMVRQAYVADNDNFEKNTFLRSMTLLGEGLLTANGATWTRQRRLINPAFNHKEIKRIYPTMLHCAEAALSKLAAAVKADPGKPVRMDVVLNRLTLDIICRSAFGSEVDAMFGPELLVSVSQAFNDYLHAVPRSLQLSGVVPFFRFLPFKLNRGVWRSEKVLRDAMSKIIAARMAKHKQRQQQGGEGAPNGSSNEHAPATLEHAPATSEHAPAKSATQGRTDLLELMMNATEGTTGAENGAHVGERPAEQTLTADLLMANSITFLLAGHETTGNLLAWTTLLLSQHPEWQERAREEVNALFQANGGGTPSFDQLNELKVTGWILNESLRLYPPAAAMGRTCTKTTTLKSSTPGAQPQAVTVPAGCDILIPISLVHRDKQLWGEDAEEFRPDRFANGIGKAALHPGAFMPFSLGPRTCIGQNFATVESKAILGMMLRKFRWRVSDDYVHHPELAITHRPKKGLPVNLTVLD